MINLFTPERSLPAPQSNWTNFWRLSLVKELVLSDEDKSRSIAELHEIPFPALRDESHCPENREVLNFLFRRATNRHDIKTLKQLEQVAEKTDAGTEWLDLNFRHWLHFQILTDNGLPSDEAKDRRRN